MLEKKNDETSAEIRCGLHPEKFYDELVLRACGQH